MALQTSKKLMRRKLKKILESLSQERKDHQSEVITKKILMHPIYQSSSRIGVYLSMPEEVNTDAIVRDILTSGKECYVPRCVDPIMVMERLQSVDDYDNMKLNRWGFKEPRPEELRESSVTRGGLDLVLVPGLGFTATGLRIGRGKGYYDRFLAEMKLLQSSTNPSSTTIGLAFREQIVDELPTSDQDVKLDLVLTS